MIRRLSAVFFLLCGLSCLALGQSRTPEFDAKAHYTKYEFRIPMRDGVHLFTAVYVPKDAGPQKLYPFLVSRTPYSVGPYGEDNVARLGPQELLESGYIFVVQDVRGRYMSEGKFEEMYPHLDVKKTPQDVDQSSDMYDTVEWLLKHVPYNNGKVGIWGISYAGFFASSSIIDSHPAIKAASPEAPMTNLFNTDDAYHNGAFMLGANFGFYSFFRPQQNPSAPERRSGSSGGAQVPDGYQLLLDAGSLADIDQKFFDGSNPLFTDQMRHTTFDDYWKTRDISRHFHNIHCAVLTVGGWFDAEDLQGPFTTYATIEKNNPGIFNAIVVGPWVHGGWAHWQGHSLGRVNFDSDTGEFYRKHIFAQFFEQTLKGDGQPKLPEAYIFETGTNVWRQYASWPPKQAKPAMLYLLAGGKLGWSAPQGSDAQYDEYVSDPNRPVPYINYNYPARPPQEYMASDQRFAATRPDVLVYQSDPLESDVTIVGPVSPKLWVSTSGTDSDYVVKLIDVYPDDYPEPPATSDKQPTDVQLPQATMAGYQQLVRGEPMRAKFRHSWEKPEPMTPGKTEEVDFNMPDIAHCFRRGHRIMVQVQSTWFPLVDRNPQTFLEIPDAKPSDFVKATERVYHWKEQPSAIQVLVMPGMAD